MHEPRKMSLSTDHVEIDGYRGLDVTREKVTVPCRQPDRAVTFRLLATRRS